jgi:hypothetical protein
VPCNINANVRMVQHERRIYPDKYSDMQIKRRWSQTSQLGVVLLDEPASLACSSARLSLILDNALFFVTGRCDAVQFGNICLDRRGMSTEYLLKKCLRTDSTMSRARSLPPSHLRLQGDPIRTCRTSQNLLLCPFSRKPGMKSTQSGPMKNSDDFDQI